MSEISKEYKGKKRGGAGLGQGRKKTKDVKSKTFFFDTNVIEIINKFTIERGFPRGTMVEFAEIALIDLYQQMFPEDSENISLLNLDIRKSKLREILNGRKIPRIKF